MKRADTSVTRTEFYGIRPKEKKRFRIIVECGVPYRCGNDPEEWACPVALHGLHKIKDVHGESALQALCLSIRLLGELLRHFKESGGNIQHSNREEVSLESYFFDTSGTPLK
jgi:hypothetical protein